MSNWENNIFGMVSREEWLNVGFQITRPNDPIDSLFGDEKTVNLVAYWQSIAAEYQIPVMAQFHSFDTEARKTFRIPIDTHNIEKGLVKVKINQSERMRALTRRGVGNDEMYDYVLRDGVRLADQVVTRSKVAKNELMATGKVTIDENDLDLSVNYGVPEDQTNLELDLAPDADIPSQLQDIVDKAVEKGVTLNGLEVSRKNITKLRNNAAIQKAINGNIGAGALVARSALDAYLETEFGIGRIITNDLTYGYDAEIGSDGRPKIKTARYFPTDTFSFFSSNPAGRMGTCIWGDPPEVDTANFFPGGFSGEKPYVYVMQWSETDPAVIWTKASALFMPVLFNPNSLWIAKVKTGTTGGNSGKDDEGDEGEV